MAPNKTLAAAFIWKFKTSDNSWYLFHIMIIISLRPRAIFRYIHSKDANINEHIEQMRLSATKTLIGSSDTIVVASVSSIYGLGDPRSYLKMILNLSQYEIERNIRQLSAIQY